MDSLLSAVFLRIFSGPKGIQKQGKGENHDIFDFPGAGLKTDAKITLQFFLLGNGP